MTSNASTGSVQVVSFASGPSLSPFFPTSNLFSSIRLAISPGPEPSTFGLCGAGILRAGSAAAVSRQPASQVRAQLYPFSGYLYESARKTPAFFAKFHRSRKKENRGKKLWPPHSTASALSLLAPPVGTKPMAVSRPIRVHITSCETASDSWRQQELTLRDHFPRNDQRLELCEVPERSDVIFITDLRWENNYAALRFHPLVRLYPKKCFAISDRDEPPRFVRGILTSLTRSPWNCGRFQSGSYFLFHPDFKNPHIERRYREPEAAPPEKKYLFSFVGRRCNALRAELFAQRFSRPDVLVSDTSDYDNFVHRDPARDPRKHTYAEISLASKFILCPRGNGAASIRLFEAMQLGIAPVIISDVWVFPEGPDWRSCAVILKERELPELEQRLSQREGEWRALGARARAAYDAYFHGENYVRYLVRSALRIKTRAVVPERVVHRCWPVLIAAQKARRRLERVRRDSGWTLKNPSLRGLGLKLMNRFIAR